MEQFQPPPNVSGDAALLAMMRSHFLNTANALGTTGTLPELPTSLGAFPELMTIINCCYHPSAAKRPTARVVHRALCSLLMSYGQNHTDRAYTPHLAAKSKASGSDAATSSLMSTAH